MVRVSEHFLNNKLETAIEDLKKQLEREKNWVSSFSKITKKINFLESPWIEQELIHKIPHSVPQISKISAVDGGIISEPLAGLDLILYRAVGVTFTGIGSKVDANYTPNFDPNPLQYLGASLPSRQEFLKLATLYRLFIEYQVAIDTIKEQNPTILFLDGKVQPLTSDFQEIVNQSSTVTKMESRVKEKYRELVEISYEQNVLLCGIIKDSRSRIVSNILAKHLPEWVRQKKLMSSEVKGWTTILGNILDHNLTAGFLQKGERLAWLHGEPPGWLPPYYEFKIIHTLLRVIDEDIPIKIEVLTHNKTDNISIDIALATIYTLSQHGLPISIPTIILEADDRVKMNSMHLENMLNTISMTFGVTLDELRKRRMFKTTFD